MRLVKVLPLILLAAGLAACGKPLDDGGEEKSPEQIAQEKTYKYVNTFTRNMMNIYYLWTQEISSSIQSWKDTEEPIAKVEAVRYKDAAGNDIDRWTMCTDDYEGFYGSVSGTQKTYGFDFVLYGYDSSTVCAVVTFTYADSPARNAGLKRGDAIVQVNGKTLTRDKSNPNKVSAEAIDIIYNELLAGDNLTVTLHGGKTATMKSVEMYEDPVLLSKVFDCNGKKVGYLAYTSFTLDSYERLIRVFQDFKDAGISELILDLRYNGGGFALAEQFLASMIAPEEAVLSGDVLATEVYNKELTDYFKSINEDTKTYFKTEFAFRTSAGKQYGFSTLGANAGITKLVGIISSGSASASEALLCDLYPYLDVTLVGEQSHGKYCSGWMMQATDFYKEYADQLSDQMVQEGPKYTQNWGLYVMVSRFADKNGQTRCMPSGLTPDYAVQDAPDEGYQLGDPQETMLAKALALCGYKNAVAPRREISRTQFGERIGNIRVRPEFGRRIILPERLPKPAL